ncbi:ATP-grasp domain-containing protein [Acetobacterium sp.]|uniref:ATP-grasp domain-containing protein n=1 Tax=Acetobacterium sp. TaxID=1872094 RepID=UPI002F41F2C4
MKMNKQKKIMILGASILQLPAILKAKEMGLQVIAVDMDKNAIGFRYADICLVISTNDIPKVVAAAKLYNINGIMTLASDMPMRTVAAVAKELNIVGIDEVMALKATNKGIMRICLKDNDVPVPKFFRVKEIDEYMAVIHQFKNKCIVKPADNSGSRGVFLVNDINNNEMIMFAFEYSKKNSYGGEIIVEEYMEGPEVSVETLSVDGKVEVISITDKLTSGAPNFVEMGHSEPSDLSREIKKQIERVAISAINAIGIVNGPSHTEIIVTDDGTKIVEIGARLGGGNITTHLVPLSTGVDLVKCCIEIALGEKPDFEKKINMGAAVRYFKTNEGKLINITGVNEAKSILGVKQICFVKNIGDTVGALNNGSERIGFVIAQGYDAEDAIRICEEAIKIIDIIIE